MGKPKIRITVTTKETSPFRKDPASVGKGAHTAKQEIKNLPDLMEQRRKHQPRTRPSHPWSEFCFPGIYDSSSEDITKLIGPFVCPTSSRVADDITQEEEEEAPRREDTALQHRNKNNNSGAKQDVFDYHPSIPRTIQIPRDSGGFVESLGPYPFGIYKVQLPEYLRSPQVFQDVISVSEAYAAKLSNQWKSSKLYSLTQQDLAVVDIPQAPALIQNIQDYVLASVQNLYQPMCSIGGSVSLTMDRYQPHILKYDVMSGHCSTPLHHDRCDVTVNLMLSDSSCYTGGGTYFIDLDQTIFLQQGEMLLHPGPSVHCGREITSGTRYVLVFFIHFVPTRGIW
jgi:predicted 2-oxoglutarate/Fe(II)-dependent dioxygenase YbiX